MSKVLKAFDTGIDFFGDSFWIILPMMIIFGPVLLSHLPFATPLIVAFLILCVLVNLRVLFSTFQPTRSPATNRRGQKIGYSIAVVGTLIVCAAVFLQASTPVIVVGVSVWISGLLIATVTVLRSSSALLRDIAKSKG